MDSEAIDMLMIRAVKSDDVHQIKSIPHVIKAKDDRNQNLLFYAVRQKAYHIMTYLIQSGIDVFVDNHQGETSLHIAARLGDVKAITLLLNAQSNCDFMNKKGQTALMLAAHKGSFESVEALLNHGASLVRSDRLGNRVLHYAVQSGNLNLVQLLLKKGASPTWLNDKHESILHVAANHAYASIIKQLLNVGVNPHIQNIYEQTALHYAAKNKDDVLVKMFVSLGVCFDAKDKFNLSPYDIAKQYGNYDALNMITRFKNDYHAQDQSKFPLHMAIKHRHIDTAMMYIKKGETLMCVDRFGNLPIFYAIMNGEEYLIAQLIKHGTKLTHIAYDNNSALYHAVLSNRFNIAKRLINTQPTLLDETVHTLIKHKCDPRLNHLIYEDSAEA